MPRLSAAGLGIVVALASEARLLTGSVVPAGRPLRLADGSRLLLSGMGMEAATQAAEQLVDAGVGALAVFGVAGGLAPDLNCGQLICPQLVYAPEGQRYTTDVSWRTALSRRLTAATPSIALDNRALVSVARPLTTPQAKRAARQLFRAAAADMESAGVARVAAQRGLPFIVLRAIADEAGDVLPSALQHGIDAWGRPRAWPFLLALLRHPGLMAHLPRLARRMQLACQQLASALDTTGPGLAWPALANQQHQHSSYLPLGISKKTGYESSPLD